MFDSNMRTEAIPERVYSLCQILKNGKMEEKELRSLVEPKKESTSYFGMVRDAAKQLSLINYDEDSKQLELVVDEGDVASFSDFRRYVNRNIEKLSSGQFYKTVQIYMYNSDNLFKIEKDLQSVSKLVGVINEYDATVNLNEENMRAWRFWGTFLGFGYLHDMFFLTNASTFLKDIIRNSSVEKGKAYTIDEFITMLHPSISICLSQEDENSRRMNLALSNAFRTLNDLGVIELKTVNDRSDEWNMTNMNLHPFSSIITDVVYQGE